MMKKQIHTVILKIKRFALPIFICTLTLFLSCSPSHILNYKEDVSRDYTYIDFVRNPEPFKVTSEVGGEHIRYIKILGFEGDKFLVELTQIKGDVMFNLSGLGFDIKKCPANNIETALVRDMETIISIAVYAHPYGEYTLTITKL
ncbi:MAG: hypothetical protein KKE44_04275 [Proteobacteria bacterium]|nr:hypothetical protein [Pseudomonadota bacterium]MBU1581947.1 hypothetical protein [Pseudomonadota bacterium]MBU2453797.1 hypothetical protein [Pseudomonadota bacterium]MBU2627361.1 hypothetical protein [Pseudomonadota bacterium]